MHRKLMLKVLGTRLYVHIKSRRRATAQCFLVGETPQVKPIAIVTYVATPKDSEWLAQAEEKTEGIRTGSKLAEWWIMD